MRYVIAGMMALLMPLIHFTSANAAVFDLKSDWSNTANPNGVWSYNEGANPLPHQDVLGSPYCVSDKQSGWGPSNGRQAPPPPFLPLWFKAVQSSPSDSYGNIEDWEAGDIVTHSQDDGNGKDKGKSNVTFTFPGPNPGFANISGSVWIARDIGRAVGWALYHNGKLLTEGSVSSGDPNIRDKPLILNRDKPLNVSYKRANPFNLAAGSGGASAIANVPLHPGDVIKLEFTSKVDAANEIVGDFVGVNLRIATDPEPSGSQASAAIYDPVADYDAGWKAGNNPNGVWTYGWSSTLNSPLNLYKQKDNQKDYNPNTNFDVWNDANELSGKTPCIYKNVGAKYSDSNIDIPAGALILHGGGPSGNDYSHVVWTAPHDGSFSLDVTFTARQITTNYQTNVDILVKGKKLFEGTLNHNGEKCSDNVVLPLIAGDKIDFAVGIPGSGLHGESTQLEAKITDVTEPSPRQGLKQRPSTEKHVRELAKYLDGVKIAAPVTYRQLSVYPILVEGVPLLRGRWLTLDKAISRGILEVSEKPGGSVPVVRVKNHSRDDNVLIMTGEVIAGGMQTRTIRNDVVLAPGQSIDLDVFCVEAHRWTGGGKFSGGSKTMLPQSIQRELRKEGCDQSKVWSEVARNNSSLKAENSTGSLEAALNSPHVRRDLEDVRRKIVPQIPRGTVGFIFVDRGRALGAEFFGGENLARELLPKLLDSYVVDYVILRDSGFHYPDGKIGPPPGWSTPPASTAFDGDGKTDNRVAIDFFEQVCRAGSQRAMTPGSGAGIRTRPCESKVNMTFLLGDGVSMDDTPVHYGVQCGERNEPKPTQRPRPSIIYPNPAQQGPMNQR